MGGILISPDGIHHICHCRTPLEIYSPFVSGDKPIRYRNINELELTPHYAQCSIIAPWSNYLSTLSNSCDNFTTFFGVNVSFLHEYAPLIQNHLVLN